MWYNIARCTVVFAMSKSFIIEAILFTDNLVSSVELIKSISHLKDSKADTYVSSKATGFFKPVVKGKCFAEKRVEI